MLSIELVELALTKKFTVVGAVAASEALVAGQDALFAVIAAGGVPGRYVTDVKLTAYGFEFVKVKQIAAGGPPGYIRPFAQVDGVIVMDTALAAVALPLPVPVALNKA